MTTEVTEADLPHLRRCVELATEAVEALGPRGELTAAECHRIGRFWRRRRSG